MQISTTILLGLPVVTENGERLGTLQEVVVDVESQTVRQYMVQPPFLKKFSAKSLLIAPSQVVRITKDAMVVKDVTIPALEASTSPAI